MGGIKGQAAAVQLENHTLFAANAVILFVMAGALFLAGRKRDNEPYWRSWWQANVLLGAALIVYIIEARLPSLLIATVPNGLLIAGFGLRWCAARQFGGREAPPAFVWGPALLFVVLCMVPAVAGSYGTVYICANIALALLSGVTAWEFWRDRGDRLPSRYGLVAAYAIMGASFAVRIGQGVIDGTKFGYHLPLDAMLTVHLAIALFYTTASGAFALSIAYEHSAAGLAHAASHDPLTGLLNRRAFNHAMRRLAAGGSGPLSLLLVDIDHFKQINDRYGHAAGDAALRACADICRNCLGSDDVIARIGGEEFAIVLPGMGPRRAHALTERLCHAVRSTPVAFESHHIHMTISIGLCHAAASGFDLDEMMRKADSGLYRAKKAGRNRIAQAVA